MKKQEKFKFEYFEKDGHLCMRYDGDNSSINGDIGKVQYCGLSSKGHVTDGSIYDCIGLSFCKIRIIDDSGESFYYGQHPSFKDRLAKFVVVEDSSPQKILTGFIDGTVRRIPLEIEIEKDHIIYIIETGRNTDRKSHIDKAKSSKAVFAKRTSEINKAENERMKQLAKIFYEEHKEEVAIFGMHSEKIKEQITSYEGMIDREEEKLAQAIKSSDKRYIEQRISKFKRIIKHAHETLVRRESASAE